MTVFFVNTNPIELLSTPHQVKIPLLHFAPTRTGLETIAWSIKRKGFR